MALIKMYPLGTAAGKNSLRNQVRKVKIVEKSTGISCSCTLCKWPVHLFYRHNFAFDDVNYCICPNRSALCECKGLGALNMLKSIYL